MIKQRDVKIKIRDFKWQIKSNNVFVIIGYFSLGML